MAVLPLTVLTATVGFSLMQLGVGFWNGNNMTNAISNMDRKYHNAGNSIFAAVNNYSAAVGIALAASIVSVFQNNASSLSHGTALGIRWTYIMDLILTIIAAAMSLRIMKMTDALKAEKDEA